MTLFFTAIDNTLQNEHQSFGFLHVLYTVYGATILLDLFVHITWEMKEAKCGRLKGFVSINRSQKLWLDSLFI